MTEALSPWRDLGNGMGFSIGVLVELISEWRITGGILSEGYDWAGFDDACREHGGSWARRWLRRAAVEAVILVVDHSYETSESACELFADEGFEVLVATSALEALDAARTQLPHVILLDLSIPGMRGEDVARALSGHPATRQSHIVGLSAGDDPALQQRAMDAGCALVLRRPIDFPSLLGWIRGVLAKR